MKDLGCEVTNLRDSNATYWDNLLWRIVMHYGKIPRATLGVTWPSVTSGSHGTTVLHFELLLRRKCGKSRVCAEHTSGPVSGHATSGDVSMTSLPVKRPHYGGYCATSCCACTQHTSGQGRFRSCDFRLHHRKCQLSCTHILLTSNVSFIIHIQTDNTSNPNYYFFAFLIFWFVEIDIEDCVTNSTLSLSHYAVQFHGLRNSFVISSLYFEQAMMYRVLQSGLIIYGAFWCLTMWRMIHWIAVL